MFWTAAAAIAVAVSVLAPSSAFAHGGTDTQQAHVGGGCNSQYKVSHGDSDCLAAWWGNTPPVSTGHAGGSTYGAKTENDCDDYGEVRAHVDMLNTGDTHFHLTDSSKYRGYLNSNDISGISCCINESDLCYKQQVKKKNGKIKVWTGTGTTMDTVNVSTHVKRYLYCNDNPDSIYCVNDDDGDAFTVPTLVCGPSDNRRECRASDCNWAFNHAENDIVGDYCTLDSYSYEDGFCTLDATCSRPADGYGELSTNIEIFLRHIKKKIGVCSGTEGYYLTDEDMCY